MSKPKHALNAAVTLAEHLHADYASRGRIVAMYWNDDTWFGRSDGFWDYIVEMPNGRTAPFGEFEVHGA